VKSDATTNVVTRALALPFQTARRVRQRGFAAPLSALALILGCAIDCASAKGHTDVPTANSDPAADPSASVTVQSASKPNRNTNSGNPGQDVAKELLAPMSDCELAMCTGNAAAPLVESIRTRAADARSCYEDALKAAPTLKGRVLVEIRVTRQGKACPIKLVQNDLASSTTLVPCLRALMEQTYPRPVAGCVDLSLPLKFVPEFIEADAGPGG
jgi:hypothetical protein